jgi:putative membrane protein
MSKKQRYHPLSWIIEFFQQLKNFVVPIILALVGWREVSLIYLSMGLFVLISGVASLQYATRYYQLTTDSLIVYTGVLNKKETVIPYERIQTLKQQQWFFFKPFHVVRITIETAGGSSTEAEAILTAVPETVVQQLEELRHQQRETREIKVYEVTTSQILVFSLTNLSIFATFFAILAFVDQIIPASWSTWLLTVGEQFLQAGWLMLLLVGCSVLLLVSALSIIRHMIFYYRFRVTRQPETLTLERGLLERKTQKIPLTKIQGLQINQQVLRKLFGLVSVELLLASGQEDDDELKQVFLLPIVHEKEVSQVLRTLLPEWQFPNAELHYTSRNKTWYFLRIPLMILIPIIVGVFFIRPWLSIIGILLFISWLLIEKVTSYYQGYVIINQQLCIQQYFFFTKIQTFVKRAKIQALYEETSKWLYLKEIYHVRLFIKANTSAASLRLRYIDKEDLSKIKAFYQKK